MFWVFPSASIAAELEGIVKELINPDLIAKVKRGCSEYALSFPEYNKFDANGKSSMIMIQLEGFRGKTRQRVPIY